MTSLKPFFIRCALAAAYRRQERRNTVLRRRSRQVLLAGLAILVSACGDDSDSASQRAASSAPAATGVSVWPVELDTLVVRRRWSGTLEPLRVLAVQAPRAGRIEALEIAEGDRVQRGDVLVRMTAPEIQARRDVLEERRRHLEEQLQRWERLAETEAVGAADVTEAMLRLLEVQEALSAAQASLEDHIIRSPAAGVVAIVAADAGANVAGGQMLLRLEDERTLGVRLSVPARETSFLEDRANLRLRDRQGNELEIDRIVYTEDLQAGFVRAGIFLSDPPDLRRREVEVVYEASERVLIVPWTAVASDDDRTWVGLVTGDPPRVERRDVELGRGHPAGIEVKRGLAAGDLVLRFEPRAHPEGQLVRPVGYE